MSTLYITREYYNCGPPLDVLATDYRELPLQFVQEAAIFPTWSGRGTETKPHRPQVEQCSRLTCSLGDICAFVQEAANFPTWSGRGTEAKTHRPQMEYVPIGYK